MQTFISQNLKFLRKKSKISQKYISEKLKVSVQTISGWETRKNTPSLEKVNEISTLFNISIDDLLKKDLARVGVSPSPGQSRNDNNKKSSYVILLEQAIRVNCPDLAKQLNLI